MRDLVPRTARWFWLLAWLALLGLLTLYFSRQFQPEVTARGELSLPRDPAGHYRLEGAINGQPVQLMLDTGATRVTLPKAVAQRLGITSHGQQQVSTAGGPVTVGMGRIEKLEMGPLTLYDLAVFINPADPGQTVLVGMNAIGKLEMVQRGQRLLLRPLQE
ncbi:aspartyl protease family protein [Aeromonas sp. RU39B]|uniref:retropepsin-like aspartic protease family protein n=1 Tax=Aeromonas sp. RU39B TaxID=1907416 RepID=UPI00095640EE|nr:retropepsin-like aspartic protease [Aeromonas sp. RU39B]SIR46804.1 aspartyl protease family protein [Aeromonas sp. RU39B]